MDVVGIDGISDYAKFFDEYNPNWEKDSEYNLMFLRAQQNYANDLLVKRGYLFLNDVYKMLGFEPTRAGQVVGWRYEPEESNCDGYVSFGIYNANRETARDFVNGYERSNQCIFCHSASASFHNTECRMCAVFCAILCDRGDYNVSRKMFLRLYVYLAR